MFLDILKTINEYDLQEFDESTFNDPVTQKEIDSFIDESRMALQYTPCDEYLELLRLTNGFVWEHIIYDTVEFLESNIEHREICGDRTVILFGSVGNLHQYTYNTKNKTYNIANMCCNTDEDFYSFKTFGELIDEIFKTAYDEQLSD